MFLELYIKASAFPPHTHKPSMLTMRAVAPTNASPELQFFLRSQYKDYSRPHSLAQTNMLHSQRKIKSLILPLIHAETRHIFKIQHLRLIILWKVLCMCSYTK